MSKFFSKRQLIDQCGFEVEEALLILDYQKTLPILIENEGLAGFCVNARDLWKQLGCPHGKFTDWINTRIKGYSLSKDLDFKVFSANAEKISRGRPSKDFMLTLDISKQLAMVEKTDNGAKARRYFLLMEQAVKRNAKWELVRAPLKKKYKEMQDALDKYLMRQIQRNADEWDYRYEADAINVIATGFKAQEIRHFVGCKDNVTRDSLTTVYNEYLLKLEELNIVYLGLNIGRYDRYKMLKDSFDVLFPNAIPLRDNVSMNRINENKQKLLDEVKSKMEIVAKAS